MSAQACHTCHLPIWSGLPPSVSPYTLCGGPVRKSRAINRKKANTDCEKDEKLQTDDF